MVDITLFGATGFTGGLTADYLAVHLPADASWAIAGRSRSKLEAIAERIKATGRSVPELVVANGEDAESMAQMAQNTRVLITTVGPYLRYGEAAVKAAAEAMGGKGGGGRPDMAQAGGADITQADAAIKAAEAAMGA